MTSWKNSPYSSCSHSYSHLPYVCFYDTHGPVHQVGVYDKKPYGGGLRKRRKDIFTLLHGIKSANQRRKGGLGKKKMHDFNRAMIAKIGWNLLVDIEIMHIWCDPWLLGMEDLKSTVPPGGFFVGKHESGCGPH